METKIVDDYQALSELAANEVISLIKEIPTAVICLPSGNTPLGMCQGIVAKVKKEKVDVSRCSFIGLDEWIGVPKENAGSCAFFFYHHLLKPLDILDEQIFLFDALSNDLESECRKMDNIIAEKNGIDLMIVGIGLNGHIGFNEPGTAFNLLSHVITLHKTTTTVGQKYFSETITLSKGITLGLAHLMRAKKVILIANGIDKSSVIAQTLKDGVSEMVPASFLQIHKNSLFILDKEAASLL
jgi:glucosamine-6-phosphate isomerase